MEDKASHPLGRIVPAVGTNSSNGCNNNRFGRELYHLPQAHQDRYTLIQWCRQNLKYTVHTPLHTPFIPLIYNVLQQKCMQCMQIPQKNKSQKKKVAKSERFKVLIALK